MLRIILEAFLGLVVEETVRKYVPRFLRHAWMLILCIATWELGELGKVFALEAFKMAKDRNLILPSYVAVAVLGAALFSVYWWGVGRALTALAVSKRLEESPYCYAVLFMPSPLDNIPSGRLKLVMANPTKVPITEATITVIDVTGWEDEKPLDVGKDKIFTATKYLPIIYAQGEANLGLAVAEKDCELQLEIITRQGHFVERISLTLNPWSQRIDLGWADFTTPQKPPVMPYLSVPILTDFDPQVQPPKWVQPSK